MIEFKKNKPPRQFKLGEYTIIDHGLIHLHPDSSKTHEFVTFADKDGKNCDFAATSWGFYLGPSLNSRLKKEGFKAALIRNPKGQVYAVAVNTLYLDSFKRYVAREKSEILFWFEEKFPCEE